MIRKLALIIGNSEYEDSSLARLATPDADVRTLAEVLRAPEIGGFDEVLTLVNQPFSDVHPAIADFFAEKRPDDLLLLYFSGHGVLDDQGRLYLAVKNTRRNRVSGTAISASFITDEMNNSRSRRQVLVLDCCHSGAFARGAKGVMGAKAVTPATFKGGYGRVVLTATDATQYAWEGDQVIGQAENSVFTHYLIQGLQSGAADANADGWITLDELYDFVYDQVQAITPRQTPNKFSYREQGEIILARSPRRGAQPTQLPSELIQTLHSPLPWVREGAVRELDRLLRSQNPGLSLAALQALQQLAQDDSRVVASASQAALAAYTQAQPAQLQTQNTLPAPAEAYSPAPGIEAPSTSWIGHTLGGRYKIESLLGQGGMSAVYKGADPNLHRAVAIKLIHPHLSSDPEFVRRFEQEAAAVAQLRHPNIIQVFDFDHEGEVYYMVLEYLAGQTLQARLAELAADQQRPPLADTLRVIALVCDAAAYAHQRGLVHRDLKPGNVMLDPSGQPILMDFGVARILGSQQHTATGALIGTVAYMSPEQVRGEHPDARADIYSLGVMLYEMTAGKPPFEAESALTVMLKHLHEPAPDVRQFAGDAPEELVAVIEKALTKDPADRFQTASEMAAALRAIDQQLAEAAARAEAERKAQEEAERRAREKEEQERLARERAEAERLAAQRADEERRARERAEQERRAREKQEREKAEQERLARERAASEQVTRPARDGAGVKPIPQPKPRPALPRLAWLLGAGAVVLMLILGLGWLALPGLFNPPSLPSPEKMAQVPGGSYTVGLDQGDGNHAPRQPVDLETFWIDQFEVTNAEYADFLKATGRPSLDFPADMADHPVQGVTWQLAAEYCQWADKRLPTEAEWEAAARGLAGNLFPWGDDEDAVEHPTDGTYPVGTVPANRSEFHVYDMAGNVWEWVDEPYAEVEPGNQILRGASWDFFRVDMAYRLQGKPDTPTMIATAGIRCAVDRVK